MRLKQMYALSLCFVLFAVLTPRAFAQGGFACDGVTGITAAITNLINSSTPGSVVQLPTGVCVLDAKLVINKSITLSGASTTGTTLFLKSGVNTDAIEVSASGITIQNLTVNGNIAGQTANKNAITFDDGLSDLTVKESMIQNAGNDCLFFGSDSNVRVEDNTIRGCQHNQLTYSSRNATTNNIWVIENLIDGSQAGPLSFCAVLIGIEATAGTLNNVIVKDNIVMYNLRSGETDGIVVSTGGRPPTINNVVVAHNMVSTAGTPSGANNGIELWGVNQFAVSANVVTNAKSGILINPCSTCLLGGTITENSVGDSTGVGAVGIYERVAAVAITGNTVNGYSGSGGSGIITSADSTSIFSNSLYNNTHQIIIRGNNSIASANLLSGGSYGILTDVSVNGLFLVNNKFANTFYGIMFRGPSYTGGVATGNVFTGVRFLYYGIPATGMSIVGMNNLVPCPAGKSAPVSINSNGELVQGACN